ncbi:MAG: response regulator, partial [Ghiorsea sp.]
MDGVSVARHVRQQDNPNKDVPMMGLSAHATQQVIDECLSVGMNDFLMKPIEPAVIVQKMQALLID